MSKKNPENRADRNPVREKEDPDYDLTAVGDAAELALLNPDSVIQLDDEKEKDKSQEKNEEEKEMKEDTENQEKDKEEGKEEKVNEAKSDPAHDSQNSNSAQALQSSTAPGLVAGLLRLAASLLSGETPPEELSSLLDAAKAMEAIEMARAEGEIAGRNAAIEERLRPVPVGAPDLAGAPSMARSGKNSIFDLARSAR